MLIAGGPGLLVGIVAATLLLGLLFLLVHRDRTYRARAAFEVLQVSLRFSAILKTMGEGVFQVSGEGQLVYLNPASEQLLGYKKEEVIGHRMHDLIHHGADGRESCGGHDCPVNGVIAKGIIHHCPKDRFARKDGSLITVEYTCSPLIQYGKINGAVLVFRDITERSDIEKALRDSEQRYRNLVEKSGGLICTHNMEGVLLSVNETSAAALGYTPAELEGRNLREFLAPAVQHKFDWYLKAISEWGLHSGLMRVLTKDGEEIVWSYSNRVINTPDSARYVLGHAHDVTAQVMAEEALKISEEKLQAALEKEQHLSRVDFLTNVPNRRTFYGAVELEAKRSRRYARPITLAYIDVDNFKTVNDTFGHSVGDDLLKLVASTIQLNIRGTDTLARLGGDEFGLLLPETDSDGASNVMSKVQSQLQIAVAQQNLPVTFSVGVVTFGVALETVDAMMKRADDLMYSAKRTGKSKVVALAE